MPRLTTGASVLLAATPLAGCATMADDDAVTTAAAETTAMVGGAAMYPSRAIIENPVESADHTTVVTRVKADLVGTLSGAGPFTTFATTNTAFAKLPAGPADALLRPENKSMLGVLTYHVVAGRLSAADLMPRIAAGRGRARLTTGAGGALTAQMMGGNVMLIDANGGMAHITQANVIQANGAIHVTNGVSLPG